MFRRVLYPTDFSDVSRKALEYVKKLRQSGAEEVVILHVIDEVPNVVRVELCEPEGPEDAEMPLARTPEFCDPEYLQERAREDLIPVENELVEIGLKVKSRIETGTPLKEILRVEEEEDVSAVVIGSHARGSVEEMILGSVSESVIRKSKKPVLVIK